MHLSARRVPAGTDEELVSLRLSSDRMVTSAALREQLALKIRRQGGRRPPLPSGRTRRRNEGAGKSGRWHEPFLVDRAQRIKSLWGIEPALRSYSASVRHSRSAPADRADVPIPAE